MKQYELELLKQAELEVSESYEWYEEQQKGLGGKFYKEVDICLTSIRNNPRLHAIRYDEEIRTALLQKFPFLIIYWIEEDKRIIYIISVFHTSRHPQY